MKHRHSLVRRGKAKQSGSLNVAILQLRHLVIVVFIGGLGVHGALSNELENREFKIAAPLIDRVGNAMLGQLQRRTGCLPRASLAAEIDGTQFYADFTYTLESAKELGDDPIKAIAAKLNLIARNGSVIASAIALCHPNRFADTVNVFVETRNGISAKMSFPYRSAGEKYLYVNDAARFELSDDHVFFGDEILVPAPSGRTNRRLPRKNWSFRLSIRKPDGSGYILNYRDEQSMSDVWGNGRTGD